MRKVCIFTGTRAEYGILSRLIRKIADDSELQLQIVATNMHLSPEFGLTYKEIESDGFHIDKKVEMLLSSDTSNGTVKSMGLATIGFADALEDLNPDLVVILGDRYEMLCAAQACLIYNIPIAHIAGGGITEGAYDDAIRHCITKMSHLHFTSTKEHRNRVIQLGEQPNRVFWSGSLGVDNIRNEEILTREELEKSINFSLGSKFLLVTYHPVTMENESAANQCDALLSALEEVNSDYQVLFTLPNSDTNGRVISAKVKDYVTSNPDRAFAVCSLGKRRYYSALKYASAVVGNSSSGIIEAPIFKTPTLNIGNRQEGRTRCESIVDVSPFYNDIKKGLLRVLSSEFVKIALNTISPYEKENSVDTVFQVIKTFPLEGITKKHFYDIK